MLVQRFLASLKTAAAAGRADAVTALANAYFRSNLAPHARSAAEAAMTLMLDDASPLVRRALAEAVAASPRTPIHIVLTLAQDQPDIAAIVIRRSPRLTDAELVDLVGGGCERIHMAVATRTVLSRSVCAALAEVADATACLGLLRNEGAEIAPMTLKRVVERHGREPDIRESLLARPDLPLSLRHALIEQLGQALRELAVGRAWLRPDRAADVARDACERATLQLARDSLGERSEWELTALVRDLKAQGRLTSALLLRAVCTGAVPFFEAALAELSGVPLRRVAILARGGWHAGFRSLCDRAGLPHTTFPAFAAAVEIFGETQRRAGPRPRPCARRMIDEIVARCDAQGADERLLALLRRYAAEAARDEARALQPQAA